MCVFEPMMNLELGEAEDLFAVADGAVLSGQWQSSSLNLLSRPPALRMLVPMCYFPLVHTLYLEVSRRDGSQ